MGVNRLGSGCISLGLIHGGIGSSVDNRPHVVLIKNRLNSVCIGNIESATSASNNLNAVGSTLL